MFEDVIIGGAALIDEVIPWNPNYTHQHWECAKMALRNFFHKDAEDARVDVFLFLLEGDPIVGPVASLIDKTLTAADVFLLSYEYNICLVTRMY